MDVSPPDGNPRHVRRARQASYLTICALTAYGILLAVHFATVNAAPGETGLGAISLIKFGYIGNPYIIPTGPTAHVSPGMAYLIAATYLLFGITSVPSAVALGVLATAAYSASMIVVIRILDLYHARWASYLSAAALFIITMPYMFQDIVYFRQWDQPYGALILVFALFVFERVRTTRRKYLPVLLLSGLAVFSSLFSPAVIPTIFCCIALSVYLRRHYERPALSIAIASAILVCGFLPWGIRNALLLGKFILTRSNFGLELALGNRTGALRHILSHGGGVITTSIHPHDNLAAARELARIGEVHYMARMQRLAISWIEAHPLKFIELTLLRIRFLVLPLFHSVKWSPLLGGRLAGGMIIGFGILKLFSYVINAIYTRYLLMLLLFCGLPQLPYVVTHVNSRYAFVVQFTSIVFIALLPTLLQERHPRMRASVQSTSTLRGLP